MGKGSPYLGSVFSLGQSAGRDANNVMVIVNFAPDSIEVKVHDLRKIDVA